MFRLLVLSLLTWVIFNSWLQPREEAFYAAADRVEAQIAAEWAAVIEVAGPAAVRDYSFIASQNSRAYVRWRLLNIQRYAEIGRRLHPPKTVPETWLQHWYAGLDAFSAQGHLAFSGLHDGDVELVAQAMSLCVKGWEELAQREQTRSN